jgi:hypothetical protein
MNDEDLKRFRDYANHYQGSDVAMLMEHIDAQDKQITLLKAALISERAERLVNGTETCVVPDDELPKGGFEDCYCTDEPTKCPGFAYLKGVAHKQLARELPEIDWEDMK